MIKKITNDTLKPIVLNYRYTTDSAYEIEVSKIEAATWNFKLTLVALPSTVVKASTSTLFDPVVENPLNFKYSQDGRDIAYIQLGYQSWNRRMRIWDFLIDDDFRRSGIGSQLMDLAKVEARRVGARMLVLETQSCNVPAINFYLKHGFELIGFDLAHYTNNDIERNEFKMEFGFEIA